MGPDVADYASVCDFIIFGDLITMNKKASVSSFYVNDALEEALDLVGNCLDSLVFAISFHKVKVLL